MMPAVTLKRDNTWVIELNTPLHGPQGEIAELILRPLSLEQIVRWGRDEIPSQLALLSEMANTPERLLRLMIAPDIDRVLIAFSAILPQSVLGSIRERNSPLATPEEQLAGQGPPVSIPDQQDPRFPHVAGEVMRFPEPPKFAPGPVTRPVQQPSDQVGVDMAMPETMRPVTNNG